MTELRPQNSDLRPKPLVSVIVPSYNQGQFIRDTIESCLSQDYRPIEVLIIDGASTDNTVDVLHEYDDVPEIKWVSEPDSGVVEAVNKGFAMAKGEIGAIQSSDDFYLPGALKRGVEELQRRPSCGFVFGDIIKVDAGGNELMRSVLKPFSVENVLTLQTWIPQPSCFFRMPLAKELGFWRESVPYAPDTDLWFRMLLKAEAFKFDAFISKRRMHDEQRDTQGERIIRDYSQMINDWFDEFGAPPSLRPAANAGIEFMKSRYGQAGGDPYETAFELFPPLRDRITRPESASSLAKELGRRAKRKVFGKKLKS